MEKTLINLEVFILKYVEESIDLNKKERVNFELKYEHTLRVRQNIAKLSLYMNFDDNSMLISEIIGLLHDIGRFKQYRLYKSFSDSNTKSHATLSVEMINEYKLLNDLKLEDQELIKMAIEYHNHILLPKSLEKRLYKFSTLIRDADKLDAFYLETLELESRKYNLGELSVEHNFSKKIIEDLRQERQVDFSNIKYKYDRILGILGLIFNLEYSETLKIVKENEYVEKLINKIPPDIELKEVKNICLNFIDKEIKTRE